MRKLLGLSALALIIGVSGASAASRPGASYDYLQNASACPIYHCPVNGG